ncbi:Mlo-like protein [Thalictrum thalictroides]|uniref:MLO-like protein n=1 Tax=Thalictrum thalictroides TaxID=46969 RepID=A0A7J6VTT9_THATH|nr:Mlo-like protein [Thalictrum thalictroides]
MAGEEENQAASLEQTSTWAVAVVVFVLLVISIIFEHLFHLSTKFFSRKRKSLNQALYRIESELMLLGFISFSLTVSQGSISKICIPKSKSKTFLPCENTKDWSNFAEEASCQKKGQVSLLSTEAVDHLQYLIFVLALFHVLSCIFTFALGMAKMRRWKAWEEETKTLEYQFSNDPRRFRLTHQTSFARRHLRFWSDNRILRWPACFIRQFYGSVSKTDYFILRHGFITAHFAETSKFDFQKFIRRALDKDFKVVVGMSLWVWILAIFFIFFQAHGFYNYLWLPFIPLLTLLLVGTKLQVIITKMCLESRDQSNVVRGTFLVKPSDNLFWFGRPQLLLHLIYFILFQNSFQLAFFTWTWYKYGLRSCFHRKTEDIVLRIVLGFLVQVLCGYVTLPLYALVTQMGSSMKKVVFTEQVIVGLKNWHRIAKRNVATSTYNSTHPSRDTSNHNSVYASREPSPSPSYTLDNSIHLSSEPSPSYKVDNTLSDEKELEVAQIHNPSSPNKEEKVQNVKNKEIYNGEVSFGWQK